MMRRVLNALTNMVANTFCPSPTGDTMDIKSPAEVGRTVLGRMQGNGRSRGSGPRRHAGRTDLTALKENISWPQPQDPETAVNTQPNALISPKRAFGQPERQASFKRLPAPLDLGTSRPRVDSNESFTDRRASPPVRHYQSMGFPRHSPTHTARAQAFYADPQHAVSPGNESESLTAFEEFSISDLRPFKFQRTEQNGPALGSELTSVIRPSAYRTYLAEDDTVHIHHSTPTALQFVEGLRHRTSLTNIRAVIITLGEFDQASLLHAVCDLLSSKHISAVQCVELFFEPDSPLGITVENALLELLEVLSSKQCESLHIEGGNGPSRYDPKNHKSPVTLSALRFPALRKLTLRSPLFLDSSNAQAGARIFFLWMCMLLRENSTSPLEELVLSVPLPSDQAENLACMARAERLRILDIDIPELDAAHLKAWLEDLPNLTELTIRGIRLPEVESGCFSTTPEVSTVAAGRSIALLRLTKISASIMFLNWLFQRPGSCPALTSIRISDEGWGTYSGSQKMWPKVEGTPVRHPLASALRLESASRTDGSGVEGDEVVEDSSAFLWVTSGSIRLSFPVLTNPERDTLPIYTPDTTVEKTVERLLDVVGTLELRISNSDGRVPAQPGWGNGVQLAWLRGFGSVECVVLDRCCVGGGAVKGGYYDEEDDIRSLYGRVRRECPRLEDGSASVQWSLREGYY